MAAKPVPKIGDFSMNDEVCVFTGYENGESCPLVLRYLDINGRTDWHSVTLASVADEIGRLGLKLVTLEENIRAPGYSTSAIGGADYFSLNADDAAATPAPVNPDPAADLSPAELRAAKDRAAAAMASVHARQSWATAAANMRGPESGETPPVPANWTRVVAKMSQGVKNAIHG